MGQHKACAPLMSGKPNFSGTFAYETFPGTYQCSSASDTNGKSENGAWQHFDLVRKPRISHTHLFLSGFTTVPLPGRAPALMSRVAEDTRVIIGFRNN